jgi:hypothetical protein
MSELWELVWGKPEVDPEALSRAIEKEAASADLDFRTRLLIRDSTQALEQYWGKDRLEKWLRESSMRAQIESIQQEDLGERGFFVREQLSEPMKPETVRRFLRDFGVHFRERIRLDVGGSIALILRGYISRATEDIDVVDEVPASIRLDQRFMDELFNSYKLVITHFQSHYLPSGWQDRLEHAGDFGNLSVYLVDVYDIAAGKLFSKRRKDLDDLRVILPKLNKQQLISHLHITTQSFLQDQAMRESAERNWYIVFGDELPAVEL